MKYTKLGMLASVVFAIGMLGINLSDSTIQLPNDAPTPIASSAGITGHIEIIQKDNEGNIKSYQQTDNAIVNDGRNCTAMLLFAYKNVGCDHQNIATWGGYTVIGLGNTTSLGGGTEIDSLPSEITGATAYGLERKSGTVGTFTNATAHSSTATQRISATFTWNGGDTNTVLNAGLFNSTTAGATSETFALKNFPSSVPMQNGDQLTVNWDISIDGTDAYS